MSKQSPQEARDEEQKRRIQMQQLSGHTGDSNAPETLKYVAEPEDIDSPIEALEWINSKSTSTANLEPEDVRSKEWVLEYHQLMARMERPPTYGIKGHLRAYVYDDAEEYRKPLKSADKIEVEGFTEVGKESSTRSKGGWGVETSTRDTKESIVRDENESGGSGLLGKLKR
jgi:hypothetical protein